MAEGPDAPAPNPAAPAAGAVPAAGDDIVSTPVSAVPLGSVIGRMRVKPEHPEDDVIDKDLILVWGERSV